MARAGGFPAITLPLPVQQLASDSVARAKKLANSNSMSCNLKSHCVPKCQVPRLPRLSLAYKYLLLLASSFSNKDLLAACRRPSSDQIRRFAVDLTILAFRQPARWCSQKQTVKFGFYPRCLVFETRAFQLDDLYFLPFFVKKGQNSYQRSLLLVPSRLDMNTSTRSIRLQEPIRKPIVNGSRGTSHCAILFVHPFVRYSLMDVTQARTKESCHTHDLPSRVSNGSSGVAMASFNNLEKILMDSTLSSTELIKKTLSDDSSSSWRTQDRLRDADVGTEFRRTCKFALSLPSPKRRSALHSLPTFSPQAREHLQS
jgi:hypothetical protein